MTKIDFYVSSSGSSDGLYSLLPSLLEKIIQKKHKVLISCNTEQIVKRVDDLLWNYNGSKFLPHGTNTEDNTQDQPILITSEPENLNNADVLISFSGKQVSGFSSFLRVFDIFENSPEQLESGRGRWKDYKDKGYELSYFTSKDGHWAKQA
ncbi:MAG: DNA polymerase III subunit chi [Proteobacteria bacterium]|nr:DNA polymerase III subunit chi [Pseudomonadota bacterium]